MKQKLLSFILLCTLLIGGAYAQSRQVSGRVTSAADGSPIQGVSVAVLGTSSGTQTDASGNYSINAEGNATLVFSYVGFASQSVGINNRAVVNAALSSDNNLEEVVVTAYGTQTRQSMTGSISTIKSEDIAQSQTANIVQSLSGKVGGVQIRSTTGQPGEAPTVRFRGVGSLSSSNQPLYVVDGVPFNGDVASISSQDIDQISFLKDAAANALYGSRGANGVIIITTKKGKGDIKINYESKVGFNSRAVPEYNIIKDPKEYYELRWQRIRLGALQDGKELAEAGQYATNSLVRDLGYNIFNVANNQIIDPITGKINPNAQLQYQDDWNKLLFKNNSVRQEHTLNIQNGTDKFSSFMSGSYLKDDGYVVNSGFERVATRVNLDYKPYDFLKLGTNVNFASTKMRNPQAGKLSSTFSNLFSWTRNVAPIYPAFARDEKGNKIYGENGDVVYDWGTGETLNADGSNTRREYITNMNPYATTLLNKQTNDNKNLSFRGFASFDFLKDFNFTYNLSYDYQDSYRIRYGTSLGGDNASYGGLITNATSFEGTLTNQQLLTYDKKFDNRNLNCM